MGPPQGVQDKVQEEMQAGPGAQVPLLQAPQVQVRRREEVPEQEEMQEGLGEEVRAAPQGRLQDPPRQGVQGGLGEGLQGCQGELPYII